MYRGYYISATGMTSARRQMNTLSNNLANANTTGFKRDKNVFKAFPQMDLHRVNDQVQDLPEGSFDPRPPIGPLNGGVTSDGTYINFDQGGMKQTGNPLDLALQGKGFFSVQMADGSTRYTRNGAFKIDSQNRLVTSKGRPVLGQNGPIQIDEDVEKIQVVGQGQVLDRQGNLLGTLQIQQFQNPQKMQKQGENLYRQGENNPPVETVENVTVKQGYLEQSNVSAIQSMVQMTNVSRKYEMNARVLRRQDQLTQQAVRTVGRV